jgi:hypothetical protein
MFIQAVSTTATDLFGNTTVTNLFSGLTSFATAMVALSVASERVTETIKQWASPWRAKLSTARSAGTTQFLAILSGIFVTALCGHNPISFPSFAAFDWTKYQDWLCLLVAGILVSGGSAFWNNVLDMLRAAKVQKEAAANALPGVAKIAP